MKPLRLISHLGTDGFQLSDGQRASTGLHLLIGFPTDQIDDNPCIDLTERAAIAGEVCRAVISPLTP